MLSVIDPDHQRCELLSLPPRRNVASAAPDKRLADKLCVRVDGATSPQRAFCIFLNVSENATERSPKGFLSSSDL